jgi:4-amino-4-deoxy-L-arabinose transferase-like glycosyltransferase
MIGAGLWLAARALVTLWPAPDSAGERVVEVLLASAALAVAAVQALGFAGWLRVEVVAGAAVGCGALGAWWSARTRTRDPRPAIEADVVLGLGAIRSSPALFAAALLGLFLAQRGLALTDLSWDGLTYHLTYPGFWIQTGGFGRFEAGGVWEQYETFPKGGEALFALAMLPFHSDLLVHAVNVPLWAGIGIAVRAVARRLGATPQAADLSALLVIACPALSAYVTPAYVEVPMTFALCVGLCAGARALVPVRKRLEVEDSYSAVQAHAQEPQSARGRSDARNDAHAHGLAPGLATRRAGALAPMWLALGLAAAIKVTALAYLALGVLATLFVMRALNPRDCVRPCAIGLLLAAAVASPWYLHNLVQCSNPFYPAALPGAVDGPAAGTVANIWAVRETSVLSQAALGDILDHLSTAPWKVRYPLGPGWLLLGAFITGAVLTAWTALRARKAPSAPARAAVVLMALALISTLLYLLSPWNGVFREANTRFLMPATSCAVVALAVCCSQPPAWVGRILGGVGVALMLVTLGTARFIRDGVIDLWAAIAVILFATAGLTLALAISSRDRRRFIAAGAFGLALSGASLHHAADARDHRRQTAYENRVDLHPISRAPALWKFVESLPPSRIAFAVGDVNATEGWFFYPLFGSRLQHEARYVDIEASETPACVRRGLIRDQPDEAAWRARLGERRFDYLVVAGRPLELQWARANTSMFTPVFTTPQNAVFRIESQVLIGR